METRHRRTDTREGQERRARPRWAATGSLWLIVLVLHAACATGIPRGSLLAEAEEAEEDETADERVRLSLPTRFGAVRVSDFELDEALTTLVLNMPLRVGGSHIPLYLHRKLALASVPLHAFLAAARAEANAPEEEKQVPKRLGPPHRRSRMGAFRRRRGLSSSASVFRK